MTEIPTLGVTPYSLALRYLGQRELPGRLSNPHILSMLGVDGREATRDDIPWCSSYVDFICWLLELPRAKSRRARKWLRVGRPVELKDAVCGWDVVILSRGGGEQPGPDVINAPGHVGFFFDSYRLLGAHDVQLLGGNQADSVSVKSYPISRVLGVRRLLP